MRALADLPQRSSSLAAQAWLVLPRHVAVRHKLISIDETPLYALPEEFAAALHEGTRPGHGTLEAPERRFLVVAAAIGSVERTPELGEWLAVEADPCIRPGGVVGFVHAILARIAAHPR